MPEGLNTIELRFRVGNRHVRIDNTRFAVTTITALLVVVGVILLWNNLSPLGFLRTPPASEPASTNQSGGSGLHVSLLVAKRNFDNQEVVFIDARSSSEYFAGHIPGALNVHPSYFSSSKAIETLKRNQPVITYCSGEACQSSVVLAEKLIRVRGHIDTRVFFGGWEAWKAAGFPVATGNSP